MTPVLLGAYVLCCLLGLGMGAFVCYSLFLLARVWWYEQNAWLTEPDAEQPKKPARKWLKLRMRKKA